MTNPSNGYPTEAKREGKLAVGLVRAGVILMMNRSDHVLIRSKRKLSITKRASGRGGGGRGGLHIHQPYPYLAMAHHLASLNQWTEPDSNTYAHIRPKNTYTHTHHMQRTSHHPLIVIRDPCSVIRDPLVK